MHKTTDSFTTSQGTSFCKHTYTHTDQTAVALRRDRTGRSVLAILGRRNVAFQSAIFNKDKVVVLEVIAATADMSQRSAVCAGRGICECHKSGALRKH